jgi:hypothetical protein
MIEVPEYSYIYGLYDLRDTDPDSIMYVGKTNNPANRLRYHRKDANGHRDHPTPVWRWILELQDAGFKIGLRVLGTV